jgi:protein SCO1/2
MMNGNCGQGYRSALRSLLIMLACAAMSAAAHANAATSSPLPANSIYHLSVPLTDHLGRNSRLSDWRGKPVLITMFYTSCEFVCPRIVEALKRTEDKLAARGYGRVPVLMVTFDLARDDMAALKQAADERHLSAPQWSLARTDAQHVRKLAAILGIQFRELPSGDFNHTSVLILLDADGRIVGRTFTLGDADPAFLKLAEKVVGKVGGK